MEFIIKRFEELTLYELYEILKVRISVFVVEQECPYQEVDEKDKNAYHVFIKDNEVIKAYLRVLDKGISFDEVSIGRVLTTERGIGLGDKILEKGIEVAKEKMNADKIRIEAQCYAKGFYERFGYEQVSDEFLEDGIPHIEMLLE